MDISTHLQMSLQVIMQMVNTTQEPSIEIAFVFLLNASFMLSYRQNDRRNGSLFAAMSSVSVSLVCGSNRHLLASCIIDDRALIDLGRRWHVCV